MEGNGNFEAKPASREWKFPFFKLNQEQQKKILGFNPQIQHFPRTKPQIPTQRLAKILLFFPVSSFPSFFMAKSGGKGGKKNPSLKKLFQFIIPGWGFYGKEIPPWHGCGMKKSGKNDGSCKSPALGSFQGSFQGFFLTFLWVWRETWELLWEGEGIQIQRDFRDSFRVESAGNGGGDAYELGICSLGIFSAHLDRCGPKSCPIQGELESPSGNPHIPWASTPEGIPGKGPSGTLCLQGSALIPAFYPDLGRFFGKRNSKAICSPTLPAGNQKRRIIGQHPMVPIPMDVSTSRNFGKRGTGT